MAEITKLERGWRLSAYGWSKSETHPTMLSAIKAAIRASNRFFQEANLVPIEHLPRRDDEKTILAELAGAMQDHLDGSPGDFSIARYALVEHRNAILKAL